MAWAQRQALSIDRYVAHLATEQIKPGDTIIGSLPVNLAAAICARGARYLHLSMELPEHLRGQELSADQLESLGARLTAYRIEQVQQDAI